jgi:hypothetical protein
MAGVLFLHHQNFKRSNIPLQLQIIMKIQLISVSYNQDESSNERKKV